MFETSIAGSLPKPAWLAETNKLWPQWMAEGDALRQAKADATLLWIKAQEDAGLDIVGDGEQSRQHFVHGFLEQVEGIDFEHKVKMGIRDNRYDAMVPQVVSALRLKGRVHAFEAQLARAHTKKKLKFTLPGPMTIVDTVADRFYGDKIKMAFAFAELLNQEALALQAAGVAYSINPRLVRGLDYYNLTVFEFITDSLGAQGTICGGGRYDYLIEQIGGKPAPAVGWAMGVERVLELLAEEGVQVPEPVPDAYAVIPDAAQVPAALRCLQGLRALGVAVQMHAGGEGGLGSMKSQFKKADASGARFALIFGADEVAAGEVTVKALRDGAGAQQRQALTDPAAWADRLKSPA